MTVHIQTKVPSISILMPVYNCALYLAEAIESILNQTFTDFELIVLDDGSTDGSAEIAKSYNDSRIVYHCNEKNLGLANNLNVGLRMAKGKYIARMDGDDISLPERLQTQIDFLDSNPDIDLCSCGMRMFGADNQIWIRDRDFEDVKITMLFYSPILHASALWRKASFEQNKLYYSQEAFPAEDYELWSRAVFYCKLVNIPELLYLYRIHGKQVTKTDMRTMEKSREIQSNYIQKTIPSISDLDVCDFVDNFLHNEGRSLLELEKLKSAYLKFIRMNAEKLFFNPEKLKRRLKRYYQNKLFNLVSTSSEEVKWHLLFEMRLNQILKLSINKIKQI